MTAEEKSRNFLVLPRVGLKFDFVPMLMSRVCSRRFKTFDLNKRLKERAKKITCSFKASILATRGERGRIIRRA
jgi:hypothetical protein